MKDLMRATAEAKVPSFINSRINRLEKTIKELDETKAMFTRELRTLERAREELIKTNIKLLAEKEAK